MHSTLKLIDEELAQIVAGIQAIGSNEPLNVVHGAWNNPGTTRDELIQIVARLKSKISERGEDPLTSNEELLSDYTRRLAFLRVHTLQHIWGASAGQAVSALMMTIQGLSDALDTALPEPQSLTLAIALERSKAKETASRLRALEAQISGLEPRTKTLIEMLNRIEAANKAADQLPVDLESLREAQVTINEILKAVKLDQIKIGDATASATSDKGKLSSKVIEAEEIVAKCSAAYAASTSHGLAAAFTERSSSLATSMWIWVCGLVAALGIGSWIGSSQLRSFSDLVKQPGADATVVVINLVLTLLSVGATAWFAWIATKQIGQRFRLAEDYAFKASVSRAYEGYRREAANIDEKFVARLFSSALSRLDEQPLRLVETATHGSPWHELASSDLIRKATDLVPDFAESVMRLAKDGLAALIPATKVVDSAKPAPKSE